MEMFGPNILMKITFSEGFRCFWKEMKDAHSAGRRKYVFRINFLYLSDAKIYCTVYRSGFPAETSTGIALIYCNI
jgi:hypothetical protein